MTALIQAWRTRLPRAARIRLGFLLLAILLFLAPFLNSARHRLPLPHGRGGTSASPLTRPADPASAVSAAFVSTPATTPVRSSVARISSAQRSRPTSTKKQAPAITPRLAPPPIMAPRIILAAKPIEGPDTR